VAENSGRPTHWYARLLPASSLFWMRAGLQHALDVFGWLDVITHRTGGWRRHGPSRNRKAQA
jgi:hypothetical protein